MKDHLRLFTSLHCRTVIIRTMLVSILVAVAAQQTYAHKLTATDDRTDIRVYNSKTGRTIWTRSWPEDVAVKWSADRRSIAILDRSSGLTTWRDGGRVQRMRVRPAKNGPGEPPEYREAMDWSPDNQRLILIIPSSQGEMTMRLGRLVVIRPAKRTTQEIEVNSVLWAEWLDARRIRYQKERYGGEQPEITLRVVSVR